MYTRPYDRETVDKLVTEANQSDDIHETMERFKRMMKKSSASTIRGSYKQALLDLGVDPKEL